MKGEQAMNGVNAMKQLLYDELGLIVRTTVGMLHKIEEDQWSYKPNEQMRTLAELAQHLALVPAVDLLILQEKPEAAIREMEARIADTVDADVLARVMEQGMRELQDYMDKLGEEQFLTMTTKPFYLDHSSTQAKWLVEIVTHAQHHRAQLFMYLKLLGHPVNMFDLY
jgi:uncharacterized damage-inducible protein DinB